ncbi:MAG: cofactor-independent phosphoglycerate mutase [Candidatus Bipolaricaulia bacterium]
MKYVILVGDGMADDPVEALDGQTPLEVAETPRMDALAQQASLMGMVRTIPRGFTSGSDIGHLSILGYDPNVYFTGRAPIEAASQGIELGPDDVAIRCNLVTLEERDGQTLMVDHSGGHLSDQQAKPLVKALKRELETDGIELHQGVGYRHLVVWRDGAELMRDLSLVGPHDIPGEPIDPHLPHPEGADGAQALRELMDRGRAAMEDLDHHTDANAIWLWGAGPSPSLPTIPERFELAGSVISAVDLVRGLGSLAGLDVVDVPGMTGYVDTNYEAKAGGALEVLHEGDDLVLVHVEAPDEVSHEGDVDTKLQAIRDFDARIVGPIVDGLEDFKDAAVLVLPDHPTSLTTRVHTADPVPFVLQRSDASFAAGAEAYHERAARETDIFIDQGHQLMDRLFAVRR